MPRSIRRPCAAKLDFAFAAARPAVGEGPPRRGLRQASLHSCRGRKSRRGPSVIGLVRKISPGFDEILRRTQISGSMLRLGARPPGPSISRVRRMYRPRGAGPLARRSGAFDRDGIGFHGITLGGGASELSIRCKRPVPKLIVVTVRSGRFATVRQNKRRHLPRRLDFQPRGVLPSPRKGNPRFQGFLGDGGAGPLGL